MSKKKKKTSVVFCPNCKGPVKCPACGSRTHSVKVVCTCKKCGEEFEVIRPK